MAVSVQLVKRYLKKTRRNGQTRIPLDDALGRSDDRQAMLRKHGYS